MTFTMDDVLAIVKPHHDKIIAEGRAERLEKINAELVTVLKGLTDDIGFAEWSTPEHAERILNDVIEAWHSKARAVIAKAECKK